MIISITGNFPTSVLVNNKVTANFQWLLALTLPPAFVNFSATDEFRWRAGVFEPISCIIVTVNKNLTRDSLDDPITISHLSKFATSTVHVIFLTKDLQILLVCEQGSRSAVEGGS
uniref:Uncharacterized protein n=1 Tax=Ceratitis capitata TaxID=7213 RepID=W8BXI3_CERCA